MEVILSLSISPSWWWAMDETSCQCSSSFHGIRARPPWKLFRADDASSRVSRTTGNSPLLPQHAGRTVFVAWYYHSIEILQYVAVLHEWSCFSFVTYAGACVRVWPVTCRLRVFCSLTTPPTIVNSYWYYDCRVSRERSWHKPFAFFFLSFSLLLFLILFLYFVFQIFDLPFICGEWWLTFWDYMSLWLCYIARSTYLAQVSQDTRRKRWQTSLFNFEFKLTRMPLNSRPPIRRLMINSHAD